MLNTNHSLLSLLFYNRCGPPPPPPPPTPPHPHPPPSPHPPHPPPHPTPHPPTPPPTPHPPTPQVKTRTCVCHHEYLNCIQRSQACHNTRVFASAIITVNFYHKYNCWFHCSHKFTNHQVKNVIWWTTEYILCILILSIKCWGIYSVIPVYGVS